MTLYTFGARNTTFFWKKKRLIMVTLAYQYIGVVSIDIIPFWFIINPKLSQFKKIT